MYYREYIKPDSLVTTLQLNQRANISIVCRHGGRNVWCAFRGRKRHHRADPKRQVHFQFASNA